VFDAFKDCRCFLDTAKKVISIEAGRAYDYFLLFQINANLIVKPNIYIPVMLMTLTIKTLFRHLQLKIFG